MSAFFKTGDYVFIKRPHLYRPPGYDYGQIVEINESFGMWPIGITTVAEKIKQPLWPLSFYAPEGLIIISPEKYQQEYDLYLALHTIRKI